MKHLHTVVILAGALLASSCGVREIDGEGAVKSEDRSVTSATKLHLSAPVVANVTVQPGAATSVQLSGYENLLQYVETMVEGSTLHIRLKPSVDINTDQKLTATIVVASLDKLELDGAADANVGGIVSGSDFEIEISGAGDASIDQVTVSSLDVSISGAGKAAIKAGTASKAKYDVSGAGSIHAFGLQGDNVDADVSGAGNVEVSAMTHLDADVSGVGSIKYKGNPSSVKSDASGVGKITAVN
jgi:hypothetical protein